MSKKAKKIYELIDNLQRQLTTALNVIENKIEDEFIRLEDIIDKLKEELEEKEGT